ncbi:MAG: 7-cyano-7-deazaguanine synthase [Phycisphaeraceae bacterium]|nr:7-cyano-7-deazaguanine synthase [Phycisphaeraceae bacterium]
MPSTVDAWAMSSATNPNALILSDGGVGSLVAVWREWVSRPTVRGGTDIRAALRTVIRGEAASASVLLGTSPPGTPRAAAAARQAELAGVPFVQSVECGIMESLSSAALLRAAEIGAARGLSRIVWPVHLGGGTSSAAMTTAADRAAQVSQLALLDLPRAGGPRTLEIETPLLDLSDAQVLELALDLDVPLPRLRDAVSGLEAAGGSCWWCEGTSAGKASMCGACPSCERWRAAWMAIDPAGLLMDGGT